MLAENEGSNKAKQDEDKKDNEDKSDDEEKIE